MLPGWRKSAKFGICNCYQLLVLGICIALIRIWEFNYADPDPVLYSSKNLKPDGFKTLFKENVK